MSIYRHGGCTNRTSPSACSSLIPIGTGPIPGTLKSSGCVFHKGFLFLAASAASAAWKVGWSEVSGAGKNFGKFVFRPKVILESIRCGAMPQYDHHPAVFGRCSGCSVGHQKTRARQRENLVRLRGIKYHTVLFPFQFLKPGIRVLGSNPGAACAWKG